VRSRLRPILLAVAPIVGCATLSPIPRGTCGNYIVDRGEDCERFVPGNDPTLHCGAVDSGAMACRFTCDRDQPATQGCPAGFGCGTDKICRAPTGSFVATAYRAPTLARALRAGDFDGDGLAEVVAVSNRNIEVFGVDKAEAALVQRARLVPAFRENYMPAIGEAADAPDYLTLIRGDGLASVFVKRPPHSLEAWFFSAFPIDGTDFRLLVADVLPGDATKDQGLEPLVLFEKTEGDVTLRYLNPAIVPATLAKLSHHPSDLARRWAVGRFDERMPCDALALPFPKDNTITVYRLCRKTADGEAFEPNAADARNLLPTTITLDAGYTLGPGGAHVIDLDGDGHLDLVLDARKDTAPNDEAPLVAFGTGDGRFHGEPIPVAPGPGFPDETARVSPWLYECSVGAFPLAIGQLTVGDRVPDCITRGGVYYRTSRLEARLWPALGAFTEAVVADVNANGLADVVAATSGSLEILNSTGTFANRYSQPVSSPVDLAVGDVDGDLAADVVFRQEDGLDALYGHAGTWPDAPVPLGTISGVEQILSGAVSNATGGFDDVADLGVVSRLPQAQDPSRPFSVALLRGNTARQLEAPFGLGRPTADEGTRPAPIELLVTGRFVPGAADTLGVVAATNTTNAGRAGRQLWFVPAGATQPFDPVAAKPGTDFLEGEFDWSNSRGIAVDLDGDHVDEIVVVAPPVAAPTGTPPNTDGRVWIGAMQAGAFGVRASFPLAIREGRDPRIEILAGDFDGDRKVDVAFRVEDAERSKLLVAFNDIGQLGTPIEVAVDGPFKARAITIAHTRKDAAETLLVATERLHPVAFEGRVAHLGPAIESVEVAGDVSLAAADFDGDGVDDLAVSDGSEVALYFGTAVRP
jgi:hypothetical protein